MTRIDIESRLRFQFDNTWTAVKWDEEISYRNGLGASCAPHDAKAVDIVATQYRAAIHMIEVKDPRGHEVEYRAANTNEGLARLIGAKVRDTLAGLVYARSRVDGDHLLAHVKALFHERDQRVWVVFWYEVDHLAAPLANALKGLIELELSWLKPKVVVTNRRFEHPLAGLNVTSLAGAPHER